MAKTQKFDKKKFEATRMSLGKSPKKAPEKKGVPVYKSGFTAPNVARNYTSPSTKKGIITSLD